LINGASVVADLTPIGVKVKNLEQTKPLARLNGEQRVAAWERAQDRAGNRALSGFDLNKAAEEVAPKSKRKHKPTNEADIKKAAKNKKAREQRLRRKQEVEEREQKERIEKAQQEWETHVFQVKPQCALYGHTCTVVDLGPDTDADSLARLFLDGDDYDDAAFFRGGRLVAIVRNGEPTIFDVDEKSGTGK
jgi:hypothetical protein